MATRSRPAQGDNSGPKHRPRPAYKADAAPTVVSRGTLSHPKDPKRSLGGRTAPNATPKIVNL